jgi:hypothetical protein
VDAAQIDSIAERQTAGQMYFTMMFTVATQHRSFKAKRQAWEPLCRHPNLRDEHHISVKVSARSALGRLAYLVL